MNIYAFGMKLSAFDATTRFKWCPIVLRHVFARVFQLRRSRRSRPLVRARHPRGRERAVQGRDREGDDLDILRRPGIQACVRPRPLGLELWQARAGPGPSVREKNQAAGGSHPCRCGAFLPGRRRRRRVRGSILQGARCCAQRAAWGCACFLPKYIRGLGLGLGGCRDGGSCMRSMTSRRSPMHVAAPGSTKVPREASTRTSPRTVIESIASLYTPKLNGLRPPLNIRSRPGSWVLSGPAMRAASRSRTSAWRSQSIGIRRFI